MIRLRSTPQPHDSGGFETGVKRTQLGDNTESVYQYR